MVKQIAHHTQHKAAWATVFNSNICPVMTEMAPVREMLHPIRTPAVALQLASMGAFLKESWGLSFGNWDIMMAGDLCSKMT